MTAANSQAEPKQEKTGAGEIEDRNKRHRSR